MAVEWLIAEEGSDAAHSLRGGSDELHAPRECARADRVQRHGDRTECLCGGPELICQLAEKRKKPSAAACEESRFTL